MMFNVLQRAHAEVQADSQKIAMSVDASEERTKKEMRSITNKLASLQDQISNQKVDLKKELTNQEDDVRRRFDAVSVAMKVLTDTMVEKGD